MGDFTIAPTPKGRKVVAPAPAAPATGATPAPSPSSTTGVSGTSVEDFLGVAGVQTNWGSANVRVPGAGTYFNLTRSGTQVERVWQTTTVDQAVLNYVGAFLQNTPAVQTINEALIAGGLVRAGASGNEFQSAYEKALTATAQMMKTNPNASIFDGIQFLGGATTGSGTGGTYKDVMRYTDEQIRQKAINAYQTILGTTPTDAEIAEFGRALRAGAAAAPSVQKVSANGKSRETTAGFDERAFTAGFMANKIPDPNADLGGAAGGIQDLIDNYRQNYGVNPTGGFVQNAIKRIVSAEDKATAQADLEAQLKEQAKLLYPGLADKIEAGISVRAIADPLIGTVAKLLEKSDMSIGLDNKYVSDALQNKNDKGEYQIQDRNGVARAVRSSAEWLETRNAKETMLSAADGIIKQFGFKR